jgi:hypothetical protein
VLVLPVGGAASWQAIVSRLKDSVIPATPRVCNRFVINRVIQQNSSRVVKRQCGLNLALSYSSSSQSKSAQGMIRWALLGWSQNGEGGIRTLGMELPAIQQISNLPLSSTQPPLQVS